MESVVLSNEERIWGAELPAGAKLLALFLLREYATKGKWRHPRISRVAKAVGLSRSTVYRSLAILNRKGIAFAGGANSNYSRYIELGASWRGIP